MSAAMVRKRAMNTETLYAMMMARFVMPLRQLSFLLDG
jgi:hypothetical protein